MNNKVQFQAIPKSDINSFRPVFQKYYKEVTQSNSQDSDKYFDNYWTDQDRIPYFMVKDLEKIGFAFIWESSKQVFVLTEFCVFSEFRNKGIGSMVSKELFSKLKGSWEVYSLLINDNATRLWERNISEYSENSFEKKRIKNDYYDGFAFYFKST